MPTPITQPNRGTLAIADPGGRRLPIGVIVLDKLRQERVVVLVPVDAQLPGEFRFRFAYAYEHMTAVRVELTVGTGTTRQEVHVIGKVELSGLPPRDRGAPVEVVLHHNGDSLTLRVIDSELGVSKEGVIPVKG